MDKNNSNDKKILYFTKGELITPLTHLRVVGPLEYENIVIKTIGKVEELNRKTLSDVSLIVLQRDFPDNVFIYHEILNQARSFNIPVVFDLDDNLLALPENHPDRISYHYASSLLPIYEALVLADYVTVSTKKLKEIFQHLNKNVYILPNFLDDSLWPFHLPIRNKKTELITIGYMGGESHKPDIEWIAPVLEKLNQKFDGRVNFLFYGVKPPDKLLSLQNVNYISIKSYDYEEFIYDFHHLNIDIFIAPLIDNEFNRCKSPIKFLEYSTLGVPGVFSDIDPYNGIVIDGKNGFLAKSLDEWFEKISILIQDPLQRYELASNAQELVKNNWLMSENAYLWTETYNKFIQMGPQNQKTDDIKLNIIASISQQLHEYHHNQKIKISESTSLLNERIAESLSFKSDIEGKDNAIQNNIRQLSDLKQIIKSLNEKINKQEKEIHLLNNQLSDYKNHFQSLSDQQKEKEKEYQILLEQLSDEKNLIQSLSDRLNEQKRAKQSLQNQLDELKRTIQLLNANKLAKEKAYQSLSNQLKTQEKTIQSTSVKLSEKEGILSSINSQLAEKVSIIENLDKKIMNQQNEIGLLYSKISNLKEEIIFYSRSKSWRFTRPFRAIMKKLKGNKNV